MKLPLCPCCFKVSIGARQNAHNISVIFQELFSVKLDDKQLHKLLNICFKCYMRLKLTCSSWDLFRELFKRLKGDDPLEKSEIKSDVADACALSVALRCPVCLIANPTVQHVHEHLSGVERCKGCNKHFADIQQHYNQTAKCALYESKTRGATIVYHCSGACGASFVRKTLLNLHQLECKFVPTPVVVVKQENGSQTQATSITKSDKPLWKNTDHDLTTSRVVSQTSANNDSSDDNEKTDEQTAFPTLTPQRPFQYKYVVTGNSNRVYKKKRCWICSKWMTKVERHMLTHVASMPVKCRYCQKTMKHEDYLKRHEQLICKMRPNAAEAESNTFECTLCDRTCHTLHSFRAHMRSHVKVPCPICNMPVSNMAGHMGYHHDKHVVVCELCGETFANRIVLYSHTRRRHPTERDRFNCEHCDRKFTFKQDWKSHQRMHQGIVEKKHICDKCGRSFFTPTSLRNHIVLVHDKAKQHSCTVCGAIVASKSSLVVHARQHTGEKPYACDICGKAFAQRPPLNRHRRSQHNILPTQMEKCPHCDQTFATQAVLKTHMVKVH